MIDKKQRAIEIMKSIETRDKRVVLNLHPEKFIEHDLSCGDGPENFVAMIEGFPRGSARVNIVRTFEDGEYVFSHTCLDFLGPKVAFHIFRFENGLIVEHWDNRQEIPKDASPGGHTMLDGPHHAVDLDKTESNKALMRSYMEDLLAGRREKFASYFDGNNYVQHNPWVGDGLTGLVAGLQALAAKGLGVKYLRVHMILGEGNFVLVVSEGTFGDKPTGFYDLYRIEEGKIAEHWDSLQEIPPRSEWQNPNGKF